MAELASMSDIIRAEQNTDITVKFWCLTLSGATWPTRLSVFRQIPPELLRHAFLRVDLSVDGLLAGPRLGAFMYYPVADLFRCPSFFDPLRNVPAQIRMSYELALYGSAFLRLQLCSVSKVSGIVLGQRFIRPEVTFDLPKNRRFVALQGARHLTDRNFCVPPILNLASFLKRKLRVNGSHAMIFY